MTPTRCPNCGHSPNPIAYGLPDAGLRLEAALNLTLLGGCVLGVDDPVAGCRTCGADLWGHGVFSLGGDLRARLGVPSHRLEATLIDDALWLSDDTGVATVPTRDLDLVVVMAVVRVFDDAARMRRWLTRRRIAYTGEAAGTLGRVAIDGEHDVVWVWAESGELAVPAPWVRLLLHLLRDLVRTLRLRTLDDVAAFFEDHGCEVTRSPMPAG
jgi:hypothetical protein